MKKKNKNSMVLQWVEQRKKKCRRGSWIGYCPFSSSGRDTVGLYRNRHGASMRQGATRPDLSKGQAVVRATRRSSARNTARSVHDRALYHNTIFVSR